MKSRITALLGLLSFACAYLTCSLVFAEDALPSPVGHPLVEQLFAYLGMAVTALSTLAAILPRSWRVTQLFARFSADLRGILTPDPSDDPKWAQRLRKDSGSLLILAALLAAPGCAFFRDSVAPSVVECLPDRQYLIDGLANILDGENAFEVLDNIKRDKGAELVMCALQRFLDRVAVSPETATQRTTARAYIERE